MLNKKIPMNEFLQQDHEWLLANSHEKQVSLGEMLIAEGQKIDEIYFVLTGVFSYESKSGEQYVTVGPGDAIGFMTFVSGTIATSSVFASESNCRVLAIGCDKITHRLNSDIHFANRFYHMVSKLLSDRMQQLMDIFILKIQKKSSKKVSSTVLGPVPLFEDDSPNFTLISKLFKSTPSISNLFEETEKDITIYQTLLKREKKLSAATMSAEGVKLLLEILKQEGINDFDGRIIYHNASISAEEKQALLPNAIIQKTITIVIENKFVLCSGLGNFKVRSRLLKKLAKQLDLPRCNHSYINPAAFVPEVELGLLRGMVSTFFSPNRITRLNLVALLRPLENSPKEVAISLSPFESLLIPTNIFPSVVKKYAKCAYPYIPFVELDD